MIVANVDARMSILAKALVDQARLMLLDTFLLLRLHRCKCNAGKGTHCSRLFTMHILSIDC